MGRLGRREEALDALGRLRGEYEALPGSEIGEGSFTQVIVRRDALDARLAELRARLAWGAAPGERP